MMHAALWNVVWHDIAGRNHNSLACHYTLGIEVGFLLDERSTMFLGVSQAPSKTTEEDPGEMG